MIEKIFLSCVWPHVKTCFLIRSKFTNKETNDLLAINGLLDDEILVLINQHKALLTKMKLNMSNLKALIQ